MGAGPNCLDAYIAPFREKHRGQGWAKIWARASNRICFQGAGDALEPTVRHFPARR